jgi:UDP-N-acetylglucosamine:LPS N-acetylglucosamine transferase
MKVLILSASYGDGHNAAARSVRDGILELKPGADAQVVDLFEVVDPTLNTWMKKGYQTVVRYAPAVWSLVFKFLDKPNLFRRQMKGLKKLREGLAELLERERPDVVVSTYPVYAHLIQQIFSTGRPFRLITVITDAISVCSAWYLVESDLFVVADDGTAEVLKRAGVAADKVRALGFPVSPLFAQEKGRVREARRVAARPKVLYMVNTGKALTGRALSRLLALNHVELTITTGRNEGLRSRLTRKLREYGHRVRILGWTNQMPQLLMSHDLLIGKAGGAIVQEAIAAKCPMIIDQIIPGQEEGNAKLIEALGAGAVVNKEKDTADLVQEAFAENGRVWQEWRANLEKASRPDSALRIARVILGESEGASSKLETRSSKQAPNFKFERVPVGCAV